MNGILLQEFHSRVKEIESYWQYLSSAARLSEMPFVGVSEPAETLVAKMASSVSPGLRKGFDYSTVVVALYGAIEDYVERLIEQCADNINSACSSYRHLPADLRKHHERLSLRLSDRVDHPSYSGPLNFRTIVSNLHSCLENDSHFRLNREAFSLHTANVRSDVVRDMFNSLSISNIDSAVAAHPLMQKLSIELGRSQRDIYFYINDLADRRNVIAHGERPYDVISSSMIGEYFLASKIFGEALYECAAIGVFEIGIPPKAIGLGRPTAAYQSGRVVCFQPSQSFELGIGDQLFWRSQKSWKTAQIRSVQVNRNEFKKFSGKSGDKIGLGISRNGNNVGEYWVVNNYF
ncbi:MAE_28990/MAE_18760 family HEPN-like nuclease [Actinomadura hibisca]|uniref:MAE_28990/MAE_18760 family HEPN-like nuclease n=1 Tax=Actinomadura hibisca TaxID=68565 RepID=UPI000AC40585|nr:MAE_28990/MAE_18760 family HEPN-like nuclease [Actinomadura hibisca]